jgi:nucleotide-binding universal stress UspA family protein
MRGCVVVGVDGSASATRAAEVAGDLAVRHGLPLQVVHVFSWPALYPPLLPPSFAVETDPRAVSHELVDAAAAPVAAKHPGLAIQARVVDGYAPAALVDASRKAAFLVVGHRGRGGFAELLTGSVGVHVTTHARCPVLVVRGEAGTPDAPIVVGVDGSAPAISAARVAFAEARARGCHLVVARVLPAARSWPSADGNAPPQGENADPEQAGIDGIVEEYPDVKLRREIRHSHSPAHALATLADDLGAGLIVVGARGLGGFRSLLMGGTSRALVDHSPCPLLVVPPTRQNR